MRVLVTGAHGFVGRQLVDAFIRAGHEVIGTVRRDPGKATHLRLVPEGESHEALLRGCEVLVHSGGLAHQPSARSEDFKRVNRDWTHRLADEATAAGVRTVIHVSSIAAREAEACRGTAYGASKREAESAIEKLPRSGILGVNLRPPVIYGKGAPGNWAKLVKLADSPWPLPFGAVKTRRSYLSVHHLVDAILAVAGHGESTASGTYELADRERVTLAEVITALRGGLNRPMRLLPVPPSLMELPLRWLGRGILADGLFSDLAVDPARIEGTFAWKPASSTLEAMAATVIEK